MTGLNIYDQIKFFYTGEMSLESTIALIDRAKTAILGAKRNIELLNNSLSTLSETIRPGRALSIKNDITEFENIIEILEKFIVDADEKFA